MEFTLESVLASMPVHPNLEIEIARAGLTHKDIAAAIGVTPATAKKRIAGKAPFHCEDILPIRSLIKAAGAAAASSIEYLFFDTRNCKPGSEDIAAARAILDSFSETPTNPGAADQITRVCWSRATALILTLINLGGAELLLDQAKAPV